MEYFHKNTTLFHLKEVQHLNFFRHYDNTTIFFIYYIDIDPVRRE